MFKSIPLSVCLVCMAALIGVGAVSARAGGTSAPAVARQPTEFGVLASSTANVVEETLSQMQRYPLGPANSVQSGDSGLKVSTSLPPTIWSGQVNSGVGNYGIHDEHNGGEGEHYGKKGGGEGGEDGEENEHPKPAPTPEPSTLLSFGAALAIGGGVFLLGRLRKERR